MENIIAFSLAGYVFHAERPAYERLRQYLDALIAQCGTSAEGRDVVSSIEERFAELLSRLAPDNGTARLEDINRIIDQIGDVEGIGPHADTAWPHATIGRRERFRLYRDAANRVLGGVCAGLAARTSMPVWALRFVFALAALYYGVGIAIYCILWLAIPKATSAKERAEMRGQPLTFESIREEVRTQYCAAQRALRDNPGAAIRDRVWTVAERVGTALGAVFLGLLRVLFIGLGVMLMAASLMGILASAVGALVLLSKAGCSLWLSAESGAPYFASLTEARVMAALVLPTILIPLGFIFMLGLHMVTRIRLFLRPSMLFLCVWIGLIVGIGAWAGVLFYRSAEDVTLRQPRQYIELYAGDTLHVHSNLNLDSAGYPSLRQLLGTSCWQEEWYRHRVQAHVRCTQGEQAYVVVSHHAQAPSDLEGQMRLNGMKYDVRIEGDSLFIPAQFGMAHEEEATGREWVEVEVFLPNGSYLRTERGASLLFAHRYGGKRLAGTSAVAEGRLWWRNGKSRRLSSDAGDE